MSDISSTYDKAVKVYSDYLPQLKAKYNNVLTQLTNELATSQAKQGQLFGSQKTQLTNDIAKRGLTATSGDQFYDTQQLALKGNQNIQANDLLDKYAKLRNSIIADENEGIMGINSKIAGLRTSESAAEQARKEWEDEQKLLKKKFKYTKKRGKISDKQWLKTFNRQKSESDRNYALALKKYNKDAPDYINSLLKDITSAKQGVGNYQPFLREQIKRSYEGKLPQTTIEKIMEDYMSNGWEERAKKNRNKYAVTTS